MSTRIRRKRTLLGVLAAVPIALGVATVGGNQVSAGPWTPSQAPLIQQRLLDTAADIELGFQSPVAHDPPAPKNYAPSGPANQCPVRFDNNVKVDQGCLNLTSFDLQGRGQAHNETAIAANPLNPDQLLGASNDYKLGDGVDGGTEYSSDGGHSWQNSEVPLEFTRGSDFGATSVSNQCAPASTVSARMYWQGGGDPSVAWDTRGNAYFAGLHFNRGSGTSDNPDFSSGVFVHRSTGNGGASWTFPATAAATCFQKTTPGAGVPLEDKPYIAVDDGMTSPFRDRIYVTWTLFAADGSAYIFEAHSSDYGRTFSAPVAVTNTSDSSTLCPSTFGVPAGNGPCNENQFSDPFVGPDGNLYVTYANFNNGIASTPTCPVPGSTTATQPCDNHNQMLLSKSTDGGATFQPAVQAGQYNDLPDCAPYQGGQDFGRGCVPEKGSSQLSVFRATSYPSGAVNPTNPKQVVVTYGSYINKDSNSTNGCSAQGIDPADGVNLYSGVKTSGACANKILLSVSSNSGASFNGTGVSPTTMTVVNQDSGQTHTDQWWQWSAFGSDGTLAVSYYDRQYGSDETSAQMDFTLSSSSNLTTFDQRRATSSSMPSPTMFPDAQGNSVFMGDYTGLTVGGDEAHPLWTDTRDIDLITCPGSGPPQVCEFLEPGSQLANAEDIFTTKLTAKS